MRPAFVLTEVKGADLIQVKGQRAAATPGFALENVADFNIYLSRPVPNTHLESAERQTL